ncbi:putative glutathione S-transferase [Durotheca rogersii]|uniref:putative glutathione S-transferase n=1 Tax=Durotheca rogersii TaxID=419775 RepID=UPI00221E6931|nr:putative glutathione S-transferase [Durotheca rogersii]KAI5865805.1 putative glutathione S-transferase [Durotheca rogersii]
MASQEIVLFDLPSRAPNKCWSLNPWKTRLLLNYKGLPYRTEWVEYPDIKPRFKDHFPADTEKYTIPTAILADGSWVMDSAAIAERVEAQHPTPAARIDSPYVARVVAELAPAMGALVPVYLPAVHANVLTAASQPYFRATREATFGAALEDVAAGVAPGTPGRAAVLAAAAPHLRAVSALLREDPAGPFFEGARPSYADFVWAGHLLFARQLAGGIFEDVLAATGDEEVHRSLLDAVKPWSDRDDH